MPLAELKAGRDWLAEHGLESNLYLRPDPDALAAGALLARRAVGDVSFADPFAEHLDRSGPMIIVDQGIKPVHTRSAVLYVDRRPRSANVRGTVVSDQTQPSVSLLAWRLVEAPMERRWLAALGVLSREGEAALARHRLPEEADALQRLSALCVTPSLLHGTSAAKSAFAMLNNAQSPWSALSSPQAATLDAAREAVEEYAHRAAANLPRLGADAALVEIDVPAHVEGRLASAWARRLAPQPVVVANFGWNSREVHYAIRSADGRERARFLATANASRSARRGHEPPYLADGVLSPAAYERFATLVLRRCESSTMA